jgi:hypothetical protein
MSPIEIVGLIRGLALPGIVFRVVISVVGLATAFALVPGGPDSIYSVINATAAWPGLDVSGSVAVAQAWMQDPTRADDITEWAIYVAAVAVWLGVAWYPHTRHTRAAPSLVLSVSLAIAAAGAVPWGSVAWSLAILLVSAAIYRWHHGDLYAITGFAGEAVVALGLAALAVFALLFSGTRPSGRDEGEVQPSAAIDMVQERAAVVELRPARHDSKRHALG